MKLSAQQIYWLATLSRDRQRGSVLIILGRNGTYNPVQAEQRSFDALERKGLIEWHNGADAGDGPNGYRITEAGRVALTPPPSEGSSRAPERSQSGAMAVNINVNVYRRERVAKGDPNKWQADIVAEGEGDHHGVGRTPSEALKRATLHWEGYVKKRAKPEKVEPPADFDPYLAGILGRDD